MRRRLFFEWHSVLGLTTGLMLFAICWSGTVAVFAYEIDWLLNPAIRAAPTEAELDWPGLAEVATGAYPTESISWIEAPRHTGFAAMAVVETSSGALRRVYIDPATLEILGATSYLNVQRFLRSFHMALFQADYFSLAGIPIGYLAVLLFAFPLSAMLVTSLFFYRRWWRGFRKLETRKGAGAFWSDAHKLSGVWSLPLVAIICVTSFWYLAEWWLPLGNATNPEQIISSKGANIGLSNALEVARDTLPTLQVKQVFPPGERGDSYLIQGHDGGLLTRGRAGIEIDSVTGVVRSTVRSADLGVVDRLKETVDVLHFGTFGGLWTQALYFVLGLALSGLALSGAYLHAKRRSRRDDPSSMCARREIVAAYAVTISLLLLATKAGYDELSGYTLEGAGMETPVAVVIFLIAWTVSLLVPTSLWLWKLR